MLRSRSALSRPWSFFGRRAGADDGVQVAEDMGPGVPLYQLPTELPLRNGAVTVTTPHESWAYALYLPPQPVPAQPDDRFRLKLAVRVLNGQIGAGVLGSGGTAFHNYATATASRGKPWQYLELLTPSLAECGALVINNASPEGASQVELRIIEIAQAPPERIPINTDAVRTVHVISDFTSINVRDLYLDRSVGWLRPNLSFVLNNGAVWFETNEIGLKGDPVDPARRQAVVWGDSVTFGLNRGWPCLLDHFFPSYQFLNGGLEGDVYSSVLRRAVALNNEREISLNLILLGWHPHGQNGHVRTDLSRALDSINNPVLVTMPTALNRDIVDKDLSAYFRSGMIVDFSTPQKGDLAFYFYGSEKYSLEKQQDIYRHILERNEITRSVARDKGVPLIDLFSILDSGQCADFREDFFDMVHPRLRAYGKIARAVAEGLKSAAPIEAL